MPPTTFVLLPDDLLQEIARAVGQNVAASGRNALQLYARTVSRLELAHEQRSSHCTGKNPLIPLSMTCSRVRNVCLPFLFASLVLNHLVPERSLQAPSVLAYVRGIYISGVDHVVTLRSILAVATNARVIKFQGNSSALPYIFALPSLVDCTLCNVDIGWHTPKVGRPPDALRVFRMADSNRWAGIRTRDAENLRAERDFIQAVIHPNRLSLEEAVLPGETTQLCTLSAAPWPSLRILALVGAYPEDAATVPLVDVLAMLPNLRSLTFGLAPRRCQAALHVWPPGHVPSNPPALDHLVRLSLSFPRDDDLIFALVPRDLAELALRDSPRYYSRVPQRRLWPTAGDMNEVGYAAPGPLLTSAGAARIFATLPELLHLVRLELVVQSESAQGGLDPAESAMYARISAKCPSLRVLELHRYRAAEARTVPVGAILEALRTFRSLHELRLNLDFPPFGRLAGIYEDYGKMSALLDDSAPHVAAALPWLECIAILQRDTGNARRWVTWTVRQSGEGVVADKDPGTRQGDMSWL
ncbi:hypothetical protein AURDEDRAFT_115674 [Auricularia subglabra TFB-10046 SS5]|uniref:F-box domain-containing protein n=1 Tax=Auricularia subglabra (strain TFB-10046 / SS5) TaxID=717982 RepID=J0DD20_AURST|nr:hypothetical protein AURDEDRAFT_115674 [Auricularia subglabra TFB-10046 SS5]